MRAIAATIIAMKAPISNPYKKHILTSPSAKK
jgi:hypothetical protein